MLSRHPTDEELVVIFNGVLERIVSGELAGCPTETGLDWQTSEMLNLLARQRVKYPTDISACRIEFARMLDGTHAREDQERDLREFEKLTK